MPAHFRPLLKGLLLGALLGLGLVLPPRASAETSYHKLKKHLRMAERITGGLLGKTGEGLAEVLSNVTVEIDLDFDDDDQPAPRSKDGKASQPTASKPTQQATPRSDKSESVTSRKSTVEPQHVKPVEPAKTKK